eukprot:10585200-Prorocentrum_lima.AAC.1
MTPRGGRSHEGVTLYQGLNLISRRAIKQSLTALSSCEAELLGMVAGIQHGINLILSLGDVAQYVPIAQ